MSAAVRFASQFSRFVFLERIRLAVPIKSIREHARLTQVYNAFLITEDAQIFYSTGL